MTQSVRFLEEDDSFDSVKLNDRIQVIGIVALVASLIFVGLQLQQSQLIAKFEGITDGATRNLAFRTLIADNSDVWSRGCLGEELTVGEQVTFAKLLGGYVDNSYAQWNRLRQDEFSFEAAEVSSRRFARNLYRFQGLRASEEARRNWYGASGLFQNSEIVEWRTQIKKEMARLAREEPNPNIDVRWCGH